MSKTIYTDRDVEDLARRGARELAIADDVYLTDLARERAEKLGVVLRSASSTGGTPAPIDISSQNTDQLVNQVKADVIAKLGSQVDPAMIEKIVRRVVGQLEIIS